MDRLHLSQHISRQFNSEIEDVRRQVLAMGGLVEVQLRQAVDAMVKMSRELADEVLRNDAQVNQFEMQIDQAIISPSVGASPLRAICAF